MDKNHQNRLGKTDSCCGGIWQINYLQTLQRFGYLEVLLHLCRRKQIGNYKIDMQPIRLTYKSLLPERLSGRTDALYIGLMVL